MKEKNHIDHIVKDFLEGRLTARQRKYFLELVMRSNKTAELERIYHSVFEQIEELSGKEVEMLQRLLQDERKPKGVVRYITPFMKYAAVFAMLCGIYFVYQWAVTPIDGSVRILSGQGDNALTSYTLPDGSELVLRGNSTFEVLEYTEQARKILLRGEAKFSVIPSKTPFFVQTESGYFTKVLGTKFSVQDVDGKYRVAVERGRVSVGNGEDILGVLAKGDSLVVDGAVQLYSSVTNPLVFDSTKLGHVLAVINQTYDTNVELAENLDGNVKCTAVFEKDLSVTEIVEILCEMYGYIYAIEGQKIIIQSS